MGSLFYLAEIGNPPENVLSGAGQPPVTEQTLYSNDCNDIIEL